MDEERVSRRRWGLYIASTVDAVFITLVGGVIEGTAGNIATLILYIIWAILLGLYARTFFERSSSFIIRCLYYVVCSALPLAFFGSFNGVAPHLWLPICSCMGIFVGIAIRDCCIQITRYVSQRMRRKILRLLDANESTLPQYHFYNQPSSAQAIASNDTHDASYLTALYEDTTSGTTLPPSLERADRTEAESGHSSTRQGSDASERPQSHGHDLRRTPLAGDGTTINPWADY